MFFKQYYARHLAQASYLVGDEPSGIAAVVDPHEDVNWYLGEAARLGLRIKHLLLTHLHAGLLRDQIALRERAEAEMYLGSRAEVDYPFFPVKDGDILEFGNVRIKILEAPGHSIESILILLYDLKRDSRNPVSVLTGGTLLVNDICGPRVFPWRMRHRTEELAAMLYDSLHSKILALPGDTTLYPAHASGRPARGQQTPGIVSSIADQRKSNYALQPMTRKEFVRMATSGLPHDRYRPLKAQRARLQTASLDALLELRDRGVPILDLRGLPQFAGGHVAGSMHIPLTGSFLHWFKRLFEAGGRFSIVTEPGSEDDAELMLGQIRPGEAIPCLDGGMKSLAARPELVDQLERISSFTLIERMTCLTRPILLDVRTPREWRRSRIAGSVNIPLEELTDRISEVPEDREIIVYCSDGSRSSTAASILPQYRRLNVASLLGGLQACASMNPRLLVSGHGARGGSSVG